MFQVCNRLVLDGCCVVAAMVAPLIMVAFGSLIYSSFSTRARIALADIAYTIKVHGNAQQADLRIVTREHMQLFAEYTARGVLLVSKSSTPEAAELSTSKLEGQPSPPPASVAATSYDSLHSLLMVHSPTYAHGYLEAVAAKLSSALNVGREVDGDDDAIESSVDAAAGTDDGGSVTPASSSSHGAVADDSHESGSGAAAAGSTSLPSPPLPFESDPAYQSFLASLVSSHVDSVYDDGEIEVDERLVFARVAQRRAADRAGAATQQ